jgi:hypothetical protein
MAELGGLLYWTSTTDFHKETIFVLLFMSGLVILLQIYAW